jgi:hypothetical protein
MIFPAHSPRCRTPAVLIPYMCALSEDPLDPVTPENEIVRPLSVGEGLDVAVYLHLKCVEKWEMGAEDRLEERRKAVRVGEAYTPFDLCAVRFR